jgi:thiamine-monophosphate kinase
VIPYRNTLLSFLFEGTKAVTSTQPHKRRVTTTKVSHSATVYAAFRMKKTPRPMSELGLIEQIRRKFTQENKAVTLGIGDDCAILRPPSGCEVVVTTDFTLEGRHFRRDRHPPESVGHRCLARGLSDLAAMGATPMAAFLSLALPSTMLTEASGRAWTARFFDGLHTLSDLHGVPLAGGDTSESPGGRAGLVLADIVLIGSAPKGQALRRSGASAGDTLYITGQLGGAAAELSTLLKRAGRIASVKTTEGHPQLFPEPRLDVGEALLRRGMATACIDVSDGLSTDLAHLCQASALCAEIEQAAIPIHPLALKLGAGSALNAALSGGEDYELLFAAPVSLRMPSSLAGVPITRIGALTPRRTGRPTMSLLASDGSRKELKPGGWEHFSQSMPKGKKRSR